MASVWIATAENRAPKKLVGNMGLMEAKIAMIKSATSWASAGQSRTINVESGLEIHLQKVAKGKLTVVGQLWVEPYSPPSVPTGGDRYRKTEAKP